MQERKRFELIRQISLIIKEKLPNINNIFTVIDLTLPKKGGIMKVYLSVFPEKNEREIINFLNRNNFKIKKEIIKRLFLRHLPRKIIFYPSSAMKDADKVLKLIDEIEKKNSTSTTRPENREVGI